MLEEIKRLRAIAETGLLYSANAYDKERYTELYELSFGMLQNISDREIADLKIHLPLGKDY
ncbi:MAG: NUDIX hydrolase N-terminal domain-containing protein, partial [Ferruginibacter sp.]|nr:NUDIX hydrolase N-terminal domain-containing protein [Ferruginibacter sp.]